MKQLMINNSSKFIKIRMDLYNLTQAYTVKCLSFFLLSVIYPLVTFVNTFSQQGKAVLDENAEKENEERFNGITKVLHCNNSSLSV